MTRTIREKIISARTSATSGTAQVAHILLIGGHAPDEFEELRAYLDVNTALVGTTPTMDIYLQRAVTDTPDEDTDADWEDFYAFPQAVAALMEKTVHIPLGRQGSDDVAGAGGDRDMATLTADTLKPGHWGDRIRVVEKMGGTVTTSAVYDLTLVGTLRAEE
ncbi:hypothetical protein LCGC14_1226730 [marine sediment metagenome]|uniref:Uncharacterized protein n=1 Tax=marine sediment metagenome TaxID=412755 RepID=A0A0F9NRY9_9ZZZZ